MTTTNTAATAPPDPPSHGSGDPTTEPTAAPTPPPDSGRPADPGGYGVVSCNDFGCTDCVHGI